MTIDADLLLSILSLDAYNRGYGAGIDLQDKTKIAEVTVGNTAEELLDLGVAEAAGFQAVVYDVSNFDGLNQDQVISFRGTDGLYDVWSGWTLGAGYTGAGQAELALQFYSKVAGHSPFDEDGNKPLLTGHSLGAGLAGYLSLISGSSAVGFDHMPYGVGALASIYSEAQARLTADGRGDEWPPTSVEEAASLLASVGMHYPDFSDFYAYHTQDEILARVRDGTIALAFGEVLGLISPFLTLLGGAIAASQVLAERQITNDELQTFDWSALPFDSVIPDITAARHSQALLTILLFGEKEAPAENAWQIDGLSHDFLSSLFSNEVGEAAIAGNETVKGADRSEHNYGSILQKTIAYSALDGEEGLVFGNVGIRALFDDMDELGQVYRENGHDQFLDKAIFPLSFDTATIRTVLSRIVVQYAGALAINSVDSGHAAQVTGAVASDGILALAANKETIALDLSSVLWHDVLATGDYTGEGKLAPIHNDILLPYFFDQAEELRSSLDWLLPFPQINNPALDALAQAGWESDTREIFDRLHIRTLSDVTDVALSDR
ncbi:MAG: DUF2974 domain-containing protein, partial [Nitrococcus sp.]|nr:DUF2974 domain-containing protein [Nitrococcus sp.]